MAVYVDDMRSEATIQGTTGKWSHLTADSTEELNAFAARLGLRRAWIQYPGTWKEHYDVTDSKRQAALKAGAVPITLRQTGERLRARRLGTEWAYTPPPETQPVQETLWPE